MIKQLANENTLPSFPQNLTRMYIIAETTNIYQQQIIPDLLFISVAMQFKVTLQNKVSVSDRGKAMDKKPGLGISGSVGGSNPMTIGPFFFFLSFCHIFAHIHAMVLIYILKCSLFNMLSNGMFYLPIHAF